jgi:hypothetical protein
VVSTDEVQRRRHLDLSTQDERKLSDPSAVAASSRYTCCILGVTVRLSVAYAQRNVEPAENVGGSIHRFRRLSEGTMQVTEDYEADCFHRVHRANAVFRLQASQKGLAS